MKKFQAAGIPTSSARGLINYQVSSQFKHNSGVYEAKMKENVNVLALKVRINIVSCIILTLQR